MTDQHIIVGHVPPFTKPADDTQKRAHAAIAGVVHKRWARGLVYFPRDDEGLPLLTPTNVVEGREPRVHHMAPGPDRWKDRSRFYPGIAAAMAERWGEEDL